MRLLLVSYEFPPKGGTQSQHVTGLACGLAGLGWDVTVLTVEDPPTSLIDTALLERAESCARIERTWSPEPTRLVQGVRRLRDRGGAPAGGRETVAGSASPDAGGRGFTSLPRWSIRLVQAFFLPDEKTLWTRSAVRRALRLHSERPFDAILSSGPPFTSHAIARTLAGRLGVPWVADLRDPIIGGYFFRPVTPLHDRLMRRFEARVVSGARAIVTATDAIRDGIRARHPEAAARVVTLPNGFEPSDFEGESPAHDDQHFTVTYVGTFQATIRPDTLLDAVRILRDSRSAVSDDLRVRFVGPLDPDTSTAIVQRDLDGLVARTGFVAHDAAVAEMRSADALLLVLGPEPASAGILTSKLPEYLAAGRPVLALVPEGVAADVVRRAGAGEVVAPTDAAAVAEALERLHRAWREGTLPSPDPAVVADFDRSALCARLDGILRGLVENGGDR